MANLGVINDYTIKPKNITAYKLRRGVMDFTQIGMFDQYETGYAMLSVLKMPPFMTALGDKYDDVKELNNSFKTMLEYEFRGLNGLPDITAETIQINDGASNEVQMIGNVVRDTSVSVSMTFYERRGSLIAKWANYYLTGIKDPITKAKTYHGLIKDGTISEPSYDQEVFTFLYYVTDNTMMRLEKAYLLCNAQITKSEESMYDTDKGSISNRETTVEFNCYPVTGYEVDLAASKLLADITGAEVDTATNSLKSHAIPEVQLSADSLDTSTYKYAILDSSDAAGYKNEAGQSFKGILS